MGWESTSVFPLLIIPGTGPPRSGLFVYSPAVGLSELVDSIAATSGTDGAPGNAVLAGVANYFPVGAPVFAVALQNGDLVFYTAPTAAGPWSQQGTIGADASNNLNLLPAGSGAVQTGANLVVNGEETVTATSTGGVPIVDVTNLGSAIAPILRVTANAVGDLFIGGRVSGDTNSRIVIDTTSGGFPRIRFGPGNAAPDVNISRTAANTLAVNAGDLDIATAGRGLQIKEGSNARMGTAVLAAGAATVNNTSVTASTRIFLTVQLGGVNTGFLRVGTITAGTSFTIISSNAADTSTVAWLLVEPG